MRAAGLVWTGFLLLVTAGNLVAFVGEHRGGATASLVFATAVASRLAFAAFLLLLMVFFVLRPRPHAKARGLGARAVALCGTFLPTCFGLLPRDEGSAFLNLASLVCIAVGNILAVYGMSHVSRSSSMMAEARRLVVTGPYRIVQHPVYLFEEIAVVGVMLPLLWSPGVATIALSIFAVQVWCQFRRMRNEEAVLAAAFPHHAEYRRCTPRLLPGIY